MNKCLNCGKDCKNKFCSHDCHYKFRKKNKISYTKKIPLETRTCACGCGGKFTCKENSKQNYINYHGNRGKITCLKGKTYDQIMGKRKAKELKKLRSLNLKQMWKNPETVKNCGFKKGVDHSGEKNGMFGKKHSSKTLLEIGKKSAEKFSKATYKYTNTLPHRLWKMVMQGIKVWDDSWTEEHPFSFNLINTSIDIASPIKKIAIFIDGDYWHGNPRFYKPTDNIGRNNQIAKTVWKWDKCVKTCLENQGWKVLRFWEHDITFNTDKCIRELEAVL